jgi:hypothetical protein
LDRVAHLCSEGGDDNTAATKLKKTEIMFGVLHDSNVRDGQADRMGFGLQNEIVPRKPRVK